MEEQKKERQADALFVNLVSSLYSSAMHFMGKIMNPETGKIEKNLDAAKTNIEIVRMLKAKTEGNRSLEEDRILNDALSNMQLNYVDEIDRNKETAQKEKSEQDPEK